MYCTSHASFAVSSSNVNTVKNTVESTGFVDVQYVNGYVFLKRTSAKQHVAGSPQVHDNTCTFTVDSVTVTKQTDFYWASILSVRHTKMNQRPIFARCNIFGLFFEY
jgi:hypothetical protein